MGTGGQSIPGDLFIHPEEVRLYELDYATVPDKELQNFVTELPEKGVNLIIIHTHEEKE